MERTVRRLDDQSGVFCLRNLPHNARVRPAFVGKGVVLFGLTLFPDNLFRIVIGFAYDDVLFCVRSEAELCMRMQCMSLYPAIASGGALRRLSDGPFGKRCFSRKTLFGSDVTTEWISV